jgi:hypothetical protein
VGPSPALLRTRSAPSAGPERDLIEGALGAGLIETFGTGAEVLREPELATGRPDIVAVFRREKFDGDPTTRTEITHGDLQLLHHVWAEGGACVSEVTKMLRLSERDVWQRAERLLEATLLRVRATHLAARAIDCIFAATRIIAIEAKMDKWREALEQAEANLWFASHSYVLFPQRPFVSAALHQAARQGIGVAVFDGSETRVLLRAERQRIPASVGSWVLNEWVVRTNAEARK